MTVRVQSRSPYSHSVACHVIKEGIILCPLPVHHCSEVNTTQALHLSPLVLRHNHARQEKGKPLLLGITREPLSIEVARECCLPAATSKMPDNSKQELSCVSCNVSAIMRVMQGTLGCHSCLEPVSKINRLQSFFVRF